MQESEQSAVQSAHGYCVPLSHLDGNHDKRILSFIPYCSFVVLENKIMHYIVLRLFKQLISGQEYEKESNDVLLISGGCFYYNNLVKCFVLNRDVPSHNNVCVLVHKGLLCQTIWLSLLLLNYVYIVNRS